MAYIYKITNDINDKIYIGKTQFNIGKRFKEHCQDSKKGYTNRPLYNAMNKYGVEHFYIELLEETDNPEEREKYWIEYYGSFKYGYNATLGGDGKAYVDKEIIIALWNQGKKCSEIKQITGYDQKTISFYLEEEGIDRIKRKQRSSESKITAMLDKNTGEIIKVFPSAKAAARYLNKNPANIMRACNGKRKTAYGYKWKYIN